MNLPIMEQNMPKAPAKKKPTAILSQPQTAPTNGEVTQVKPAYAHLPIVYDKLLMTEYSSTSKHGPMTVNDMKVIFNWQTEKEWQEQSAAEDRAKGSANAMPAHYLYGEVYHCLNAAGEKVRCINNANNRPFDLDWCKEIMDMILSGQWAGPLTVPGETVNGETIRISRYGRVLSGQHQGTALILADEFLQKARADGTADEKYPFWKGHDHVVIETIVITGLSEDERILRTIDYVKPRLVSDMLYTMELFRSNTPTERKEMTRMLSAAIDMLWTRTDTQGYKTHPEVVGFLERHRSLLDCTEHLFRLNSAKGPDGGRKVSKLRVSAGQAAALCYLMGCNDPKGDPEYGDVYRNESPPSEKNLSWHYWDKAREFWAMLANDRLFMPVRHALGRLVASDPDKEDNVGMGGRAAEKLAILAKAWEVWKDDASGGPFTDDDLADGGTLSLAYSDLDDKGNKLPDGEIKLLDVADFYGIDCPEVIAKGKGTRQRVPEPPPPSKEEIERLSQEAQARRQTAQK
jgi:hypothetical protein